MGHTAAEAAGWCGTTERTCQAQLLAEAAGTPKLIDPDPARLTAGQIGTHHAGWLSYQSLYEWIARLEPDLFT